MAGPVDNVMASMGGNPGNLFTGYRAAQNEMADTLLKNSQAMDQQAQAAERQVDMQTKMQELENKKKFSFVLDQMGKQRQQKPTDEPMDFPTKLEDMADQMFAAGLPNEAVAAAEKASLIRSHLATAAREKAQEREQQFNRNEKIMGDFERGVQDINNEDDWAAFQMRWSAEHPNGPPAPFAGMAYDPKLIQHIRDTSKAGQERLEENRKIELTESENHHRELQDKYEASRERINQRIQDRLDRKEAAEKKGGGVVAAPDAALRNEAISMIAEQYPDIPTHEADKSAYSIASRVMELVKANRGMGRQAALDQAFAESEKAHDFKTVEEGYKVFGYPIPGITKDVVRYKPKGTAAGAAKVETESKAAGKTEDKPSGDVQVGKPNDTWAKVGNQAGALKYLQENPNTADVFKKKFGFLPKGDWLEEDLVDEKDE